MLAIAILAKVCGHSQLEAMADWAQYRAAGLVALFQLRRPTMTHARTWGWILATAVDPSSLTCVIAHAFFPSDLYHVPLRGERLLILDGKTLRGMIPAGHTQGVHLVALFEPATGVVHRSNQSQRNHRSSHAHGRLYVGWHSDGGCYGLPTQLEPPDPCPSGRLLLVRQGEPIHGARRLYRGADPTPATARLIRPTAGLACRHGLETGTWAN